MAVRVAINGFGRIGRNVFRAATRDGAPLQFVAINDLTDAETLAHLLRYDSVHGRFPEPVATNGELLCIGESETRVLSEEDPASLPWDELEIDVVVESTGVFRRREDAAKHLEAGARKVVISAPAKDPDITLCLGVNEGGYEPERHHIVSNASCTTNCLAPVAMLLHRAFVIEKGWMTTVHSYTNDQRILDLPHDKDMRRARAAALSMIPTSTGAAKALGLVLPDLADRIDGCAIRVPTPDVSVINLVVKVQRSTAAEEVNDLFREAAAGELQGILAVAERPLVSVDYIGDTSSASVDAEFTRVLDGDLIQVLAWYDNEMGYSTRVVDLVTRIGESLP